MFTVCSFHLQLVDLLGLFPLRRRVWFEDHTLLRDLEGPRPAGNRRLSFSHDFLSSLEFLRVLVGKSKAGRVCFSFDSPTIVTCLSRFVVVAFSATITGLVRGRPDQPRFPSLNAAGCSNILSDGPGGMLLLVASPPRMVTLFSCGRVCRVVRPRRRSLICLIF